MAVGFRIHAGAPMVGTAMSLEKIINVRCGLEIGQLSQQMLLGTSRRLVRLLLGGSPVGPQNEFHTDGELTQSCPVLRAVFDLAALISRNGPLAEALENQVSQAEGSPPRRSPASSTFRNSGITKRLRKKFGRLRIIYAATLLSGNSSSV